MGEISGIPLRLVTDGPLFGRPNGTLSALQNMEIVSGGWAEARGGMSELKPSGGTAVDAITAGGFSAIHQLATSFGWVRTFDSSLGAGSQYSHNRTMNGPGWLPFQSGLASDAVYFGSDMPFSRLVARIQVAGAWASATFVYEFWNGASWGALTTAETIDWTNVTDEHQFASWTLPTTWVANTVGDAGQGNVLKYWMRIRLSAITALTVAPKVSYIYGKWVGMRELYEASQNPRGGATTGTLKRQGQSSTTEEWFSISTSLFAGASSPARMCSYRGRLFIVNGKENKWWDGRDFADIGIPKAVLTGAPAPAAGTGVGIGEFRYYLAYGYGTCIAPERTHPHDIRSSYGVGQAVYLGEVITTVGNEQVTMTIGGTLPVPCSGVYIYRTQDLTGIDAAKRANFPAFLVDSLRRTTESTSPAVLEGGGVFTDANPEPLFPNIEAILYDNKPPTRMKYIAVYQNRLLLGDDDFWYWSDPFQPDVYQKATNYIALARAVGGRHMGGIEFADQMVLYTEDQTWGLTNIDLDIPQLYPIHPGVGCIAPDAIAVGDGVLSAPARDGVYAWDGTGLPQRVTKEMDETFGKMSFDTHGGSRAVIHDRRYDIKVASADLSTLGLSWRLRFETLQWSKIVHAGFANELFPLATIHSPIGHLDAGVLHPIWGKIDYSTAAGEYSLFLGELTTQDNGNNYTCLGTEHFPLPPRAVFSPKRLRAYYQAADGWGTPTFLNAVAAQIGSKPGAIGTPTPDIGSDYSMISAGFAEANRGTSDLQFTFSVPSAANGTVGAQRWFGMNLEGEMLKIQRGK